MNDYLIFAKTDSIFAKGQEQVVGSRCSEGWNGQQMPEGW
jgi:hypothetical protein